jgi:enediyne biosynthesis protein E4
MIQVREVEGGHGHYGIQHPLRQHFGLGASCTAKVTVRWPDAALTTETFELAGNKVTKLTQKP